MDAVVARLRDGAARARSDIYLPRRGGDAGRSRNGQGVVVTYYPSGPLLEYMPDRVKTPPKTAEELLAWAKANPAASCTRAPPIPVPAAPC